MSLRPRMGPVRRKRPRSVFAVALVVALALASVATGCGGDPAKGLAGDVGKARDAQALSSIEQALVAAGLIRAESGGSYGSGSADLAQKLQARDGSKQYTTAPSTGPEQIQVLAGGPVLVLVARSPSNAYLAVWQSGGETLYYKGEQPPPFSGQKPAGPGWSTAPPT
jgi:hypothetical protein